MVRNSPRLATAISLALLGGTVSCAVPVAPTGGPVDKAPPAIVQIAPAGDAVKVAVDNRTIRFTFSEYMNEASFGQAFSISPEPDSPAKIRWRGRSVAVTLPDQLTPNTTYVLTVDTRLRDANGVAFATARSYAFSTGESVSRGKISGRVADALTGQPAKQIDIFAYPVDDSVLTVLPPRARYRTQSDDAGEFIFDYLTPGKYLVAGVRDRNNNRKADELEVVAVGETLFAEATETDPTDLTLYAFLLDTRPPEFRRVQSSSSDRVTIRFSEKVVPETMDGWSITDSTDGSERIVQQAFVSADDARDVVLLTEPLSAGRYQLFVPAIPDSAGNRSTPQTTTFDPGTGTDTTTARLARFFPPSNNGVDSVSSFVSGNPFGMDLTQPIREGLSSAVSLRSGNQPVDFEGVTANGRDFRFLLNNAASVAGPIRAVVQGPSIGIPDSTISHYFVRFSERELGSLSGTVLDTTGNGTTTRIVVEAYRSADRTVAGRDIPDSTGRFEFSPLRPGTYRLRAFRDANGNGRWDPGSVAPLGGSEPLLFTADTLTVRARWESVFPDTLRFNTLYGRQSGEQ